MDEPPIEAPGPPVPVLTVTISEILLGLITFAGLFVGGTLVYGQLTTPGPPESARGSWVPPVFLGYGVASAVALVAERRRWRWALPAVIVSQLPWALGMAWAYVTVAPDWSLLAAIGLALAAMAASVLVHRARRRVDTA